MGGGGERTVPSAVSEDAATARTAIEEAVQRQSAVGEGVCYELPPPPISFTVVDHMQPHPERKRNILTAHPEIEELYGFEWKTKYLALLLSAANLSIAAYVGLNWSVLPLWAIFLAAYCVGAPINHACSMIIHDCAHDLAASTPTLNRWIGMLANLPLAVPSAMSFRRYHLEHHSHQGVIGTDMDLPPWFDVVTVRNSTVRKLLWMSCFMFSYGLRPMGWGRTKLASGWEATNIVLQMAVNVIMGVTFGPAAPAFMFCSTLLCFGVHPCAAHFIQEHFTLGTSPHESDHPQETFSYYGPLNPLILNVGYHNEHHDFSKVPWTRLPQIKAAAPEAYDSLYYHTSVFGILVDFLRREDQGPHSRIARTKDAHQRGVRELLATRKAARLAVKKTD